MTKRYESLDILRGFSVYFMVLLTHGYWAWVRIQYPIFYPILIQLAYFGTGIFVTIAGTSVFLFVSKKISNGESKKDIISNITRRALFIFIIPTFISIMYWFVKSGKMISLSYLLYWNVFQLIGAGIFAFFLIPFLRFKIRLVCYFSLFLLVFLIGHLILYYNIEPILFLASGSDFPFFPYANYILFGLFLGDFLLNVKDEEIYKYLLVICLISTFGIINWFIWLREIQYLFIESIVWSLCTLLIAFSIMHIYVDRKNRSFKFKETLVVWGRHSFSLFYVNTFLILIVELLLITYNREGFLRGIPMYQFFIIFGICVVILYFFTILWKQIDYKYGIEWFMRKFAEFSLLKEKTDENISS